MFKRIFILNIVFFMISTIALAAADFALTVNSGSGDGIHGADTSALISADAPLEGYHFLNWTTSSGGSFADLHASVTDYIMPANDATVTANFAAFTGMISTPTTKIVSSDRVASDDFGRSLAISDDTAIVSAWRHGWVGSVYLFIKSGGVWSEQQKLTASDPAVNDFFGVSVAISGDTVVVGAHLDDDNGTDSGSAYVFTRSGITWSQQAKLTGVDSATFDHFGTSVAIEGDTIVVGAPGSGVAGKVYLFTRSGASWSQFATFTSSDGAEGDSFGKSISISGDSVAVGAHANDDNGVSSGSVYIFTKSGSDWVQEGKLLASDASAGDQFGTSLSLSGNSIAVGAKYSDDKGLSSGSAYIFHRVGTTWTQQQKIISSDCVTGDQFGNAISLLNDKLIVGSVGDDDVAIGVGSAYLFLRNGSEWSEQSKFTPSDGIQNGAFGTSVAISGRNVVVGAVYDTGGGSAYTYDLLPAYTLKVVNGIGSGPFLSGVVAPIVANTPEEGHHFVDWTTNDGGAIGDDKATTTIFTMPANDVEIVANFAINSYAVNYIAGANGSIDGVLNQMVDYGSSSSEVTAKPNLGYHFLKWSDELVTATRSEVGVKGDVTLTAIFAINSYSLIYKATHGGNVSGATSQSVNYNENGSAVTAQADLNYHFVSWSDGVMTESRQDLSVSDNIDVTANFAIDTYSVVFDFDGKGVRDGGGAINQTIDYGNSALAPSVKSDVGYKFESWDRSFSLVTSNLTVKAQYSLVNYNVNYTAGANGSISGIQNQKVPYGGNSQSVTAIPDSGSSFVKWSDGSLESSRQDLNVTGDIDVIASFAVNSSFRLTVNSGAGDGQFPEGYITDITADASELGKVFNNWSSSSVSGSFEDETAISTKYTMANEDVIITANYLDGYILSVVKGSGSGTYLSAETVTIVANAPVSGMIFDSWIGDIANVADITNGTTTVLIVDNNIAIEAKYIVDPLIATKTTYGTLFTIKAKDITGMDSEFTSLPTVSGAYNNVTNAILKRITKISSLQPVDYFKCEWIRKVSLYDKRALRGANLQGVSTSSWLIDNPIQNLPLILTLKTKTVASIRLQESVKGAVIVSPEITSIERWDGNELEFGFHPQSKIIIRGKFFGKKLPTVVIEYKIANINAYRYKRLKVLRTFKFADSYGKSGKSCMDLDVGSLTYGASFIEVELPAKSWSGWGSSSYDVILSNGMGVDTASIAIADDNDNSTPIASDDNFDLQSGLRSYSLDVLANDIDANSDKMTIVIENRETALGGLVSVRNGIIKYIPPSDKKAPIADSFNYTLSDEFGGISNVATVYVNFSTIEITSLESWNGENITAVQNRSIVVIKGTDFGVIKPKVLLKYTISGVDKVVTLRVISTPKYKNYSGVDNKSYTNLSTALGEVTVKMPTTWVSGWIPQDATIEVQNKYSSASKAIAITSVNSAPVATGDSITIVSGKRTYLLDVIANDSDAESDKVTIVLTSRVSSKGIRISVDNRSNTVKYLRKKELLSTFNDYFSYYLKDSSGAVSEVVTVEIDGVLTH